MLKVLKEIYEVLGFEFAFKTFYFITIFYSLSVCQRTDLSAKRQTPLKVRYIHPKVSVAESHYLNAQQSVN